MHATPYQIAMFFPSDTKLHGAEADVPHSKHRHHMVGPIDLWEHKRIFQIQFLRLMGLDPSHRLLDLGCGTLRGGIPLIAHLHEGHYTGIEVRSQLISEAKKELHEEGLSHKKPLLLCCDNLDQVHLHHKFDVIWSFSVLIHMDNDTLGRALSLVRRHLAPNGRFFANVNFGERPDGIWQGFPLVWRPLAFYDAAFRQHGLQLAELGALKLYGHRNLQKDRATELSQRMLRGSLAGCVEP